MKINSTPMMKTSSQISSVESKVEEIVQPVEEEPVAVEGDLGSINVDPYHNDMREWHKAK